MKKRFFPGTPTSRKGPQRNTYAPKSMAARAILLDRTSVGHIRHFRDVENQGRRLQWDFYAALEQQRGEHSNAIQKAILEAAQGPFSFNRWQRIVDFHRSLTPLSTRGSVLTDPGGRFNVGDIDASKFPSFPALYLASDHATALLEKFGPADETRGLASNDYALRPSTSYSCLLLRGELESIIDLNEPQRLEPFVDIIKTFEIPKDLPKRAQQLGLENPSLVRSATDLVSVLTTVTWRVFPMQFDVPSTSQIFGRLAMSAGVEGILYPSSKTGHECLAIFPTKISGKSFVELESPVPDAVRHRRLDADTFQDFL